MDAYQKVQGDDYTATLSETFADELQLVQTLQASAQAEIQTHRIAQSDYFPITQRQMQQGWRYLRRMTRQGPRTELDLDATVQEVGRQGVLTEPIMRPRRINQTALLLLIDQTGSMVPFHGLAHRLSETALHSGRLANTQTFYFHNCPLDVVYADTDLWQDLALGDLYKQYIGANSVVLIFSDAGAARQRCNAKRVDLTAKFVYQLKTRVSNIVWLNPVPLSRWSGTTSELIAQHVNMFEATHAGFQRAITTLRSEG